MDNTALPISVILEKHQLFLDRVSRPLAYRVEHFKDTMVIGCSLILAIGERMDADREAGLDTSLLSDLFDRLEARIRAEVKAIRPNATPEWRFN